MSKEGRLRAKNTVIYLNLNIDDFKMSEELEKELSNLDAVYGIKEYL